MENFHLELDLHSEKFKIHILSLFLLGTWNSIRHLDWRLERMPRKLEIQEMISNFKPFITKLFSPISKFINFENIGFKFNISPLNLAFNLSLQIPGLNDFVRN